MIRKPHQALKQVICACAEPSERFDSNQKNVPNAILFPSLNFHRNALSSSRVKKEIVQERITFICALERLTAKTISD